MERPRLLTRLRNAIRVRNLSTSTERAYVHWVRRNVPFYGKRRPSDLDENDVPRFLIHLFTPSADYASLIRPTGATTSARCRNCSGIVT